MPPANDDAHPADWADEQLLAECDIRRTRGSGPGGQHRNKVETAIVITHRPTGVTGRASEQRSQETNRRAALARLRVELAIAVRTERATVPSSRWLARTENQRISVSAEHQDFPALLAEALDVLEGAGGDVPAAADRLQVSSSQLLKLIKKSPHAWQELNAQRQRQGLHRLS